MLLLIMEIMSRTLLLSSEDFTTEWTDFICDCDVSEIIEKLLPLYSELLLDPVKSHELSSKAALFDWRNQHKLLYLLQSEDVRLSGLTWCFMECDGNVLTMTGKLCVPIIDYNF